MEGPEQRRPTGRPLDQTGTALLAKTLGGAWYKNQMGSQTAIFFFDYC